MLKLNAFINNQIHCHSYHASFDNWITISYYNFYLVIENRINTKVQPMNWYFIWFCIHLCTTSHRDDTHLDLCWIFICYHWTGHSKLFYLSFCREKKSAMRIKTFEFVISFNFTGFGLCDLWTNWKCICIK